MVVEIRAGQKPVRPGQDLLVERVAQGFGEIRAQGLCHAPEPRPILATEEECRLQPGRRQNIGAERSGRVGLNGVFRRRPDIGRRCQNGIDRFPDSDRRGVDTQERGATHGENGRDDFGLLLPDIARRRRHGAVFAGRASAQQGERHLVRRQAQMLLKFGSRAGRVPVFDRGTEDVGQVRRGRELPELARLRVLGLCRGYYHRFVAGDRERLDPRFDILVLAAQRADFRAGLVGLIFGPAKFGEALPDFAGAELGFLLCSHGDPVPVRVAHSA